MSVERAPGPVAGSEPSLLSDDALVASAIRGDPIAFDALACRYRPMALTAAAMILGPENAEDAVQDAFLLAFQALPMIKDASKFPFWLSAITRFRALRLRRTESQHRTRAIPLDGAVLATLSYFSVVPRDEENLDGQLLAALDRIAPEYAEIIRLHFLQGMPQQDIAISLSLPLSTVKWRCYRGKELLRRALQRDDVAPSRLPASRPETLARCEGGSDSKTSSPGARKDSPEPIRSRPAAPQARSTEARVVGRIPILRGPRIKMPSVRDAGKGRPSAAALPPVTLLAPTGTKAVRA